MAPIFFKAPLTRVSGAFFAVCTFLSVSCQNCESIDLEDASCHPGNPARGESNGKPEVCRNGLDDNCIDGVDEGCDCNSDVGQPDAKDCGGDGRGNDVGACHVTTVTCVNGKFPACEPDRLPGEYADNDCNGVDDDCNGAVDDGFVPFECWTGPDYAVFNERSACAKGLVRCVKGALTECLGETLPDVERCNDRDDDCNDRVDDGTAEENETCGVDTDVGACVYGRNVCAVGGTLVCQGAVGPAAETCNGIDDDCDGVADEGADGHPLVMRCETRCGSGIAECIHGQPVNCSAREPSEIDYCDGTDDDCDGQTDEDMPCPCRLGAFHECREAPLTCGKGFQRCVTPVGCDPNTPYSCVPGWSQCELFHITDETCNNWDDDCDLLIDEAADGNPLAQTCSSPDNPLIGECAPGSSRCSAGLWGSCDGEVVPVEESCDDKDNNCDGHVDEGMNKKVDMVFVVDISGSMCPYSQTLAGALNRYSANFDGDEHRFSLLFFPGAFGRSTPYRIIANNVDFASFQAALSQLNCSGDGDEPSYDVLLELTSPSTTPINWRSDATPYIILIGDEPARTWNNVSQQMVAAQTANCQIANCQPGDKVEVFIITHKGGGSGSWGGSGQDYSSYYIEICYQESSRIIEIYPADEDRYVQDLLGVFQKVCLTGADGGMSPVGLDGGPTGASDGGPSKPDGGP
ncbi:VWA domain-containing protein [Candidatus Uhrbacteria bacterium]|nr:VWA domain-containing protein [Candidatus Uhrbacteria bacterium]